MNVTFKAAGDEQPVIVPADGAHLEGSLVLPSRAAGIVVFAHGSGSSRFSPRNRYVAGALQMAGFATLLMDLLTRKEEAIDSRTTQYRFDITLLARRLIAATDWLGRDARTHDLPAGYFGASTGAGAALIAAAERPAVVRAVVSRGGRPDLAGAALARVRAPVLLIVGGNDEPVIALNQRALTHLSGVTHLAIVPGATHLFEEPGALEQVARLAIGWFSRYLPALPQRA